MQIIIASTNEGKVQEIQGILRACTDLNIQLQSIKGLNIPEPDEPHDGYMDNARHKARYYANITKAPTLSEDAGLCIEALDGFPGVRTKDFVLESGSLDNAFNKLEQMLSKHENHNAYFICAAALYFPQTDKMLTYEGIDYGTITFPPRGNLGFGFDPIFMPKGYTQTMAELGEEVKNQIGHRAIAMKGIAQMLREAKLAIAE